MKPVVLITGNVTTVHNYPSLVLAQTYAHAVTEAGGIPLLALDNRCAKDYAHIADALLLSGGADVCPALYGQERTAANLTAEPERDAMEWALLDWFTGGRKPVLGICRGIQVLNVYFKGTLYQDILDLPGGLHTGGVMHTVDLSPNTLLHGLFGDAVTANSYHHQAVDHLAPGLKAAGMDREENGAFLEAFEHETLPVLGVQWHPERMLTTEALATGLTDMHPLFSWLVETAKAT